MFEFLEGYVVNVTSGYIVLQVSGMGFLIYTPDPYRFEINKDKLVKVYVHQRVSESFNRLYGFKNFEDKQIFENLLEVSGTGPKSALAILAGDDRVGLVTAIENNDVKFLTKFPGVGAKTAQRLILDLQGKLTNIVSVSETATTSASVANQNNELAEAILALNALGYQTKQTEKVKKKLSTIPNLSTDEYISMGLKILAD